MVFYAYKYKIVLVMIIVLFSCADLFLMSYYGIQDQLMVFLYVIIGVVALGGLLFFVFNLVPSITLDNQCKTMVARGVFDERSRNTRNLNISFAMIHLEEVRQCEVVGNSIVLSMRWGGPKTLYLSAFSKRQINTINAAISERLL